MQKAVVGVRDIDQLQWLQIYLFFGSPETCKYPYVGRKFICKRYVGKMYAHFSPAPCCGWWLQFRCCSARELCERSQQLLVSPGTILINSKFVVFFMCMPLHHDDALLQCWKLLWRSDAVVAAVESSALH